MSIKQPNLETKRLVMIPFKMEDASTVQTLAGNCNVAQKTLNISHPYKDGMAENWIATHQQNWDEKKAITYAIFLKNTRKLIGAVGLVGIKDNEGGMGFWIGEPYWRKGYCTEATKALVDFCFNDLRLSRIEAEYLVTNPASGRVMQKAGMHFKNSRMIKDRNGKQAEINVYEIKRGTIND